MIEILFCLGLSLAFLTFSYNFINEIVYEKYYMLFFMLNTIAWIILFVSGAYLLTPFLLTGELHV